MESDYSSAVEGMAKEEDRKVMDTMSDVATADYRRSERKRKDRRPLFSPDDFVSGKQASTSGFPVPQKKKRKLVRRNIPAASAADRPFDVLPDGTPFSCDLCQSPYVCNPLLSKAGSRVKRSRHMPSPWQKLNPLTGKLLTLCNACGRSLDRPRPSKAKVQPSQEEKEAFFAESRAFASSLATQLQDPDAERLYCPSFQNSACGCLQNYITGNGEDDSMLERARELLTLYKEARKLSAEKVYSVDKMETKSPEKKRMRSGTIGLGNGMKRSRRFEAFILEKRVRLKRDLQLCERATQRILSYSNNFLHKKLKTEERGSRVVRQKGKAALGLLESLDKVATYHCCVDKCVRMVHSHRNLLQQWRKRAVASQTEARRVLAEMLTPSGGVRSNCYKFISWVTGCSNSTIGKVRDQMRRTKGDREPPQHGLYSYWQQKGRNQSKGSRPSATVTHDEADSTDTFSTSMSAGMTAPLQPPGSNQSLEPVLTSTSLAVPQFSTSGTLNTGAGDQQDQLMALQQQLVQQQAAISQQQQHVQQQMLTHSNMQQLSWSHNASSLASIQQQLLMQMSQLQTAQQQLAQTIQTLQQQLALAQTSHPHLALGHQQLDLTLPQFVQQPQVANQSQQFMLTPSQQQFGQGQATQTQQFLPSHTVQQQQVLAVPNMQQQFLPAQSTQQPQFVSSQSTQQQFVSAQSMQQQQFVNAQSTQQQQFVSAQSNQQQQFVSAQSMQQQFVNAQSSLRQQFMNAQSAQQQQCVNAQSTQHQQSVNAQSMQQQQFVSAQPSQQQFVNAQSTQQQQFINAHPSQQQFVNAQSTQQQQFVNAQSTQQQQFVNAQSTQQQQFVNAQSTQQHQFVNAQSTQQQQFNMAQPAQHQMTCDPQQQFTVTTGQEQQAWPQSRTIANQQQLLPALGSQQPGAVADQQQLIPTTQQSFQSQFQSHPTQQRMPPAQQSMAQKSTTDQLLQQHSATGQLLAGTGSLGQGTTGPAQVSGQQTTGPTQSLGQQVLLTLVPQSQQQQLQGQPTSSSVQQHTTQQLHMTADSSHQQVVQLEFTNMPGSSVQPVAQQPAQGSVSNSSQSLTVTSETQLGPVRHSNQPACVALSQSEPVTHSSQSLLRSVNSQSGPVTQLAQCSRSVTGTNQLQASGVNAGVLSAGRPENAAVTISSTSSCQTGVVKSRASHAGRLKSQSGLVTVTSNQPQTGHRSHSAGRQNTHHQSGPMTVKKLLQQRACASEAPPPVTSLTPAQCLRTPTQQTSPNMVPSPSKTSVHGHLNESLCDLTEDCAEDQQVPPVAGTSPCPGQVSRTAGENRQHMAVLTCTSDISRMTTTVTRQHAPGSSVNVTTSLTQTPVPKAVSTVSAVPVVSKTVAVSPSSAGLPAPKQVVITLPLRGNLLLSGPRPNVGAGPVLAPGLTLNLRQAAPPRATLQKQTLRQAAPRIMATPVPLTVLKHAVPGPGLNTAGTVTKSAFVSTPAMAARSTGGSVCSFQGKVQRQSQNEVHATPQSMALTPATAIETSFVPVAGTGSVSVATGQSTVLLLSSTAASTQSNVLQVPTPSTSAEITSQISPAMNSPVKVTRGLAPPSTTIPATVLPASVGSVSVASLRTAPTVIMASPDTRVANVNQTSHKTQYTNQAESQTQNATQLGQTQNVMLSSPEINTHSVAMVTTQSSLPSTSPRKGKKKLKKAAKVAEVRHGPVRTVNATVQTVPPNTSLASMTRLPQSVAALAPPSYGSTSSSTTTTSSRTEVRKSASQFSTAPSHCSTAQSPTSTTARVPVGCQSVSSILSCSSVTGVVNVSPAASLQTITTTAVPAGQIRMSLPQSLPSTPTQKHLVITGVTSPQFGALLSDAPQSSTLPVQIFDTTASPPSTAPLHFVTTSAHTSQAYGQTVGNTTFTGDVCMVDIHRHPAPEMMKNQVGQAMGAASSANFIRSSDGSETCMSASSVEGQASVPPAYEHGRRERSSEKSKRTAGQSLGKHPDVRNRPALTTGTSQAAERVQNTVASQATISLTSQSVVAGGRQSGVLSDTNIQNSSVGVSTQLGRKTPGVPPAPSPAAIKTVTGVPLQTTLAKNTVSHAGVPQVRPIVMEAGVASGISHTDTTVAAQSIPVTAVTSTVSVSSAVNVTSAEAPHPDLGFPVSFTPVVDANKQMVCITSPMNLQQLQALLAHLQVPPGTGIVQITSPANSRPQGSSSDVAGTPLGSDLNAVSHAPVPVSSDVGRTVSQKTPVLSPVPPTSVAFLTTVPPKISSTVTVPSQSTAASSAVQDDPVSVSHHQPSLVSLTSQTSALNRASGGRGVSYSAEQRPSTSESLEDSSSARDVGSGSTSVSSVSTSGKSLTGNQRRAHGKKSTASKPEAKTKPRKTVVSAPGTAKSKTKSLPVSHSVVQSVTSTSTVLPSVTQTRANLHNVESSLQTHYSDDTTDRNTLLNTVPDGSHSQSHSQWSASSMLQQQHDAYLSDSQSPTLLEMRPVQPFMPAPLQQTVTSASVQQPLTASPLPMGNVAVLLGHRPSPMFDTHPPPFFSSQTERILAASPRMPEMDGDDVDLLSVHGLHHFISSSSSRSRNSSGASSIEPSITIDPTSFHLDLMQMVQQGLALAVTPVNGGDGDTG